LRGIKKAAAETPIITISDERDFHLANQAINFGALGYVSKTSSYNELQKAIMAVMDGKVYLSPELVKQTHLSHPYQKSASDISVLSSLSDRQKEVLKHIARGSSNKGISIEMNISQNTVKAHLATIFKIMGVHNRTEAFYFAARAGMPLD